MTDRLGRQLAYVLRHSADGLEMREDGSVLYDFFYGCVQVMITEFVQKMI